MRKLSSILLTSLVIISSYAAFADSVVVTETKTWRSVPITVDTGANTYTVTGTVPTDSTDYYYTYSGYRCFATQRNFVGVNAVVLKAGVSGGTDIYCYPE